MAACLHCEGVINIGVMGNGATGPVHPVGQLGLQAMISSRMASAKTGSAMSITATSRPQGSVFASRGSRRATLQLIDLLRDALRLLQEFGCAGLATAGLYRAKSVRATQ